MPQPTLFPLKDISTVSVRGMTQKQRKEFILTFKDVWEFLLHNPNEVS